MLSSRRGDKNFARAYRELFRRIFHATLWHGWRRRESSGKHFFEIGCSLLHACQKQKDTHTRELFWYYEKSILTKYFKNTRKNTRDKWCVLIFELVFLPRNIVVDFVDFKNSEVNLEMKIDTFRDFISKI